MFYYLFTVVSNSIQDVNAFKSQHPELFKKSYRSQYLTISAV
jgi:hypothetical protein